jgi:hypothetical protein
VILAPGSPRSGHADSDLRGGSLLAVGDKRFTGLGHAGQGIFDRLILCLVKLLLRNLAGIIVRKRLLQDYLNWVSYGSILVDAQNLP